MQKKTPSTSEIVGEIVLLYILNENVDIKQLNIIYLFIINLMYSSSQ